MSSTVIESRCLSRWFGEVIAVNNLSLTIGSGITGLLGPNGAGKTTLLKLALGLYSPSRGMIRIFGEPPRNNLKVLARIGYCPESDYFYDHMSGFEFVCWMVRLRGVDSRNACKMAEDACAMTGISHRMHDPVASYSQGMRRRISIAQAIAVEADLLILDEPMAGLDPESREVVFNLIRKIAESGRAVVFSSHILYEIERVTHNVVLLHQGGLIAQGDIREIRELIDEHPHTVTIETPDTQRLAAFFAAQSTTANIDLKDSRITVQTRDPNRLYQQLNDLVLDDSMEIRSIHCPDDNLQSVFEYLVKR